MRIPTEYQTIMHDGIPAFVLVPFDEFQRVKPLLEQASISNAIPQEVVEAHVLHDVPLIRAWREHLNLTQADVSERAGKNNPLWLVLSAVKGSPEHQRSRNWLMP